MRVVSSFCLLTLAGCWKAAAFAPLSLSTTNARNCKTTTTLSAVPVQDIDLAALNHAFDVFTSSTILSDAAAAVSDAEKEPGLWGSYLLIFKNTLSTVHSVVDEPLRNAGITQTWGISIALFTAGIRALLIPLSIQQNKSSEYMKALKPYMSQVKEKFKDNEEKKNRAMGKLLEDAQQNPLAGCLFSLLQLPIFLGLYRGVRLLAMDGALQEPFLWIPSLEGPVTAPDYRGLEWLTQGWQTIDGTLTPPLGWEATLAFMAMPMVLVALQSFTMNTLQPPMDDSATDEEKEQLEKTQVVLKFLPLLIGFFSLQVPAGLTIYWFTSNLFTLTQSLTVRAYFAANPPDINLPDYWDALTLEKAEDEMTTEEKRAAIQAGLSIGPTFDDLITDARFYCYIERESLRRDSEAWKRVSESESFSIPSEFESWVGPLPAPVQKAQGANESSIAASPA